MSSHFISSHFIQGATQRAVVVMQGQQERERLLRLAQHTTALRLLARRLHRQ